MNTAYYTIRVALHNSGHYFIIEFWTWNICHAVTCMQMSKKRNLQEEERRREQKREREREREREGTWISLDFLRHTLQDSFGYLSYPAESIVPICSSKGIHRSMWAIRLYLMSRPWNIVGCRVVSISSEYIVSHRVHDLFGNSSSLRTLRI